MRFNTAIAALIEFVNALYKEDTIPQPIVERLALLIAPFAPHLGEELWSALGHEDSLAYAQWPSFDPALLVADHITIAVQVLGRTRGTIDITPDMSKDEVIAMAKAHDNVARQLEGKAIVKEIYVPNKIVNLIVK